MKAQERAALMVLEADRQMNAQRSARISPPDIAAKIGTSRSLVYSYFPDADHLVEAVLDRHADLLVEAGILDALRRPSLEDALIDAARIYCEHVSDHGSAIELCLREPRIGARAGGRMRGVVLATLHRLGRLVVRELAFGTSEALAVVRILQIIPEDAARLVRSDKISRETAHRVCARLLRASVDELRPAP